MSEQEKVELPVASDDDFVMVNESDVESKEGRVEAAIEGGSPAAQQNQTDKKKSIFFESNSSFHFFYVQNLKRKIYFTNNFTRTKFTFLSNQITERRRKKNKINASASASPTNSQPQTSAGTMAPKKSTTTTTAGTPAPKKKGFRKKNNAILPTPPYHQQGISPYNRGAVHFVFSPNTRGYFSGGQSPNKKQQKQQQQKKQKQQGPKWDQLKSNKTPAITEIDQPMYAIGVVESCWRKLTGVPRQAGLCPHAESRIRVAKHFAANGALDGLEGYSHVWVLWMFHKNVQQKSAKKSRNETLNLPTKIRAPKLYLSENNTAAVPKIGVFATRSPHRPCPIGLSVVKVHLSKLKHFLVFLYVLLHFACNISSKLTFT